MTDSSIACPHCAAPNSTGAAFCTSCGKALPITSGQPRVLTADKIFASSAGAKLFGDELKKQSKAASKTLLIIACIQLIGGTIVMVLQASMLKVPFTSPSVLVGEAVVVVISLVFFGLYAWARISPLPATIVALVVYGTLVIINIISAVGQMAQGGRAGGFGGLGIGWIDIIILIMLSKGIGAGLKHRKLLASQAIATP